jgi:hypothetical protein
MFWEINLVGGRALMEIGLFSLLFLVSGLIGLAAVGEPWDRHGTMLFLVPALICFLYIKENDLIERGVVARVCGEETITCVETSKVLSAKTVMADGHIIHQEITVKINNGVEMAIFHVDDAKIVQIDAPVRLWQGSHGQLFATRFP